ncbi:hypothetical protein M0R72_06760 [Candidatus Pacearchaeota archaeon]|jgi:hypothetical protein|nr:hypothetical protein [Candidatus Pacearchaeota archaeon]
MPYVAVEPTKITIASTSVWVDIDLDNYVTLPPGGANGVAVRIVSRGDYDSGVRMKGCTLSVPYGSGTSSLEQHDMWVGVDASNVFQAYAQSNTYVSIYIIGYLTGGFEFLSQPIEYSIVTESAWTNIDFSDDIPSTALGVILLIKERDESSFGLRNDGCTDNLYSHAEGSMYHCAMMGCTNRIVEYYSTSAWDSDIYLLGYITSDALATFNTTTKTDYSTGTTGAYADLTALPVGAAVGIFEAGVTGTTHYQAALRKNGSTFDQYAYLRGRQWFTVEGDSDRIVEGKIENAALDFYLVGYFAPSTAGGNFAGVALGDCMII